jgi:hypothetical protein
MDRRPYLLGLLLPCFVVSLLSGCIPANGDGSTPKEEVEKKEYLTGVVYTEREGTKEHDCSHKIFACRED